MVKEVFKYHTYARTPPLRLNIDTCIKKTALKQTVWKTDAFVHQKMKSENLIKHMQIESHCHKS